MDDRLEKQKKVIYDLMSDKLYKPMKFKELAMLLNVSKERREELQKVLDILQNEGKITLTTKGKYHKGEDKKLVGTFQAHPRGFGFVLMEEGDDIFIGEDDINGAFQGDTVECVITAAPAEKRREGKITKVISHNVTKVVGLYQLNDTKKHGVKYGFVLPDDQKIQMDIAVPIEKSMGAVNGHKVVVELTSYGKNGRKPEGKIIEIIGHKNDPGTDILSIVKGFDLPVEFPEKVLNQAAKTPDEISEADMNGRKDLRDVLMVTIDGEDAKDLDDAVSLQMDGKDYILGVHIADVSNYVQENSALDKEALKRGTSVYLADRVIPMLPHKLSNGICSLNAGEDRLALSCIMRMDSKGVVKDHEIAETVICVNERMSYTGVKKILVDQDEEERKKYVHVVPMLEKMEKAAALLRERRHKRGSINFDFPEAKIILDDQGIPVDIVPYERNVATKMIEEFMLIANETVAEDYYWQEIPFLYRIHEAPDEEKIRTLATFINNFGFTMHVGTSEIHPKEIQKLLTKIEGSEQEDLISRLALRSMKQAKYSPENSGHFGLASPCYTHFTSPIRRYPDLQIHRIIKDQLRGRMKESKIEHYESILEEVAAQASDRERKAEEAERETVKLKKVQYMERHEGEIFEGIISGITKWGMYVELPNTVEGLVHVMNMKDDHYEYIEERHEMVGNHLGKCYKLGQKVKIRVLGTNKMTRTIDFELAEKGEKSDGEE